MQRFQFILLITLSSCSVLTSNREINCNCCINTYTDIQTALNCISDNPRTNTTADYRLLLLAFVDKDIQLNRELGWSLFDDADIINAAKKKYLLIILPSDKLATTFDDIAHKDEITYVIANQVLYPFAHWTNNAEKDFIIDRLGVGNGP